MLAYHIFVGFNVLANQPILSTTVCHIIIIHRDSGFMMLLITLFIAYISLYNLLFKSCRFAPLGLRKIESQRSTRQINLHYLVLHWFISKSVINHLWLYFQYSFC